MLDILRLLIFNLDEAITVLRNMCIYMIAKNSIDVTRYAKTLVEVLIKNMMGLIKNLKLC